MAQIKELNIIAIANRHEAPAGKLNDGDFFLLAGSETFLAAWFNCPCGNGITRYLVFTTPESHSLLVRAGKISVIGSIQARAGCQCHFWIEDNRVIWADSELKYQGIRGIIGL